MKGIIFFCLTLISIYVDGQYYFNDIVSIRQGNDQYKIWRAQKIASVKAVSYEPDNSITEGFSVSQEISRDGKRVTINTITDNQSSTTINMYDLGILKRTQTDNKGINNKIDYTYDTQGKISKVQLVTTDTAMRSTLTEVHEWSYDEYGAPLTMLKIKNLSDTITIHFIKDEQGNIGEEQWKKNGKTIESYYYYYNADKRLTDIVRYNTRLKKLLPDFVYEYNADGQPAQMTQFSLGSNNYFIWKYAYNDKGLKTQEICIDKTKKQIGRIEYQYNGFQ